MKFRTVLFYVLCFMFALVGCDKIDFLKPKKQVKEQAPVAAPAPVVKGTVVARVNNLPITLEELNQEIEAYNAMLGDKPEGKITTRDQKISYLKNEMVRRILLYQDASARGLERKEEVVRAMEKTREDLLVMELIRQEAEKIDVSSKEIEDYYNTYKEQLKEPEERQLREIVVGSEQEAKEILIQLLQGGDFATIAKERSKSATAKDGGDLGFIQPGKKSPQFDSVAFSDTLEVGKISSISKGTDGNYYILKLEGKRGGKLKSLSEMWDDIKRGLTFLKQQQQIEDLVGKLSRQAKLEFVEGEIK